MIFSPVSRIAADYRLTALVTLLAALFLASCKGTGSSGTRRPGSRLGNLPNIQVYSPVATPPHNMSRSEYPFDSGGTYRPEWVGGGGGSSRASFDEDDLPSADPEPVRVIASTPAPVTVTRTTQPTQPVYTYTPPPVSRPTESKPVPVRTKPVAQTQSKPKPKPKPAPKPTPKPSYTYHKVVKGDTLSSLSRRYGTSISAIQKANGISGTNIMLGRSLKIPR